MQPNLNERVVRLETQFSRFIEDAESEKDTRRRSRIETNGKIEIVDRKLDGACVKIEGINKKIYLAMGALGMLQMIIAWAIVVFR